MRAWEHIFLPRLDGFTPRHSQCAPSTLTPAGTVEVTGGGSRGGGKCAGLDVRRYTSGPAHAINLLCDLGQLAYPLQGSGFSPGKWS